ncbi:MAG: PAC2 family protein, partial [Actinomycetota bacterium]|nr:PAC2 family protein [Actinomycetota bacterium]
MENRYINLEWRPELERPVLIAAFTGWNDAAEAASFALATLRDSWEAQRFGVFDADEFFDYQTNRPQIKLIEGVTRTIEWPENHLSATASSLEAAGGRGAVLLSGPEPSFRWHSFSGAVIELARELGVELVVTMGALLADVPHSRPVSVAANSQDPSLVENLGLSASRYEGP